MRNGAFSSSSHATRRRVNVSNVSLRSGQTSSRHRTSGSVSTIGLASRPSANTPTTATYDPRLGFFT